MGGGSKNFKDPFTGAKLPSWAPADPIRDKAAEIAKKDKKRLQNPQDLRFNSLLKQDYEVGTEF